MNKRFPCLRCWTDLRSRDRVCRKCRKAVVQVIDDRFELKQCLKRVEEEAAFLASDHMNRRDVFVRVTHPAARKTVTDALTREALTIRDLTGTPGIPSFVHAGTLRQTGGLYTAQEYVYGVPLARALRNESATGRVEILVNAFAAVMALSEVGLVHGALSLDHFMVTGDGEIVLLDYRQVRKNGERSGGTGKPGYAAPEQWNTMQPLTLATDVFGMGALVYRGLTGRFPYSRKTHGGRPALPRKPSLACSQITDVVDDIILRAVDFDPDNRFASPRELHGALTTTFGSDTVPDAFECGFPSSLQCVVAASATTAFRVARTTAVGLWYGARGLWWSTRKTAKFIKTYPRVAVVAIAMLGFMAFASRALPLQSTRPKHSSVDVPDAAPADPVVDAPVLATTPAPTSMLQILTWPVSTVYRDGKVLAEAPGRTMHRIPSGEQRLELVSKRGEKRTLIINTRPGRRYVLQYNFDTKDFHVEETSS